jgi:two-component system, OmpR family, phosphate regulon sensor histidine kinase PhoR
MERESLIAALPLPAVLIDAEGRIEAANHRAEALFGIALAGQQHVAALRRPELLDTIDRVQAGGPAATVRFLTRQGERDLIWRVTVAAAGAGRGRLPVLVSFEDATPVEQAGQMRRDFVANVSHELKTPLTAVLGFIETLRSSARDDAVARERFLGIMEREARRMNRLVSDLLSLSRVEEDERMRPRDPVGLAALTRRTLATLRAMLEEAGVEVIPQLPEHEVTVAGDADQLQQVLANLIENAVKYGRKADSPRGRVVLRLIPPGHDPVLGVAAARIEVADEGEGIDPVHIPRLTERFYRVDTHRSRASGGTGLGLAIVKHIVSRHRGRLRIDSRRGLGSTFTVVLPAAPELT